MVWADVSKFWWVEVSLGRPPTVNQGFSNREIIRKLLVSVLQAQRDTRSCLNSNKTMRSRRVGRCPRDTSTAAGSDWSGMRAWVNVYIWGWATAHQNSEAPPRPPMVTSVIPSPFRSMTPCMDWPKNFTFSPSPPAAILWGDTTEPMKVF